MSTAPEFPRTPIEVERLTLDREPELAAMLRQLKAMRYSAEAGTFEEMLLLLVGRAICAGGNMVLEQQQSRRRA